MVCSRCKKRPAVVFITRMEGEKTVNDGLCLVCAKELGIKPVNDMLEKFGITDDDMEQMDQQLGELMSLSGEDGEDGFTPGGAPAFPFLQNLFGAQAGEQEKKETEAPADEKEKDSAKEQKKKERKRKFLTQYCTDLTARAREGKIDAIIGRDREIYRVVQILSRRTKNNPCLIGEPGVGKTAIAEGLAIRIAAGQVPPRLLDKEIHLLDLTALVAGTQFRGQFESRIKGLVDEVKAEGNIILFIDEVHNLVGTGDAEGSMSAANILKPALSRGEIQVIGATTFNEYRKHIEKDAALERRFQPVTVEEPTVDDTVSMLMGIKGYYETFHGVQISDPLIRRAVTLSERYITDRFLPDKAIDLLDEACAAAALNNKAADKYEQMQRQAAFLRGEEEEEMGQESIDYEKLANTRAQLMKVEQDAAAIKEAALGAQVTEDDRAVDRHPCLQGAGERAEQACPYRGTSESQNHRPGRGCGPGFRRHPAQPGADKPPPPPCLLHFRGIHRRGQDRAGQGARRRTVRHARNPHPPGYVRIHGETRRFPHHRLPSRLRGL